MEDYPSQSRKNSIPRNREVLRKILNKYRSIRLHRMIAKSQYFNEEWYRKNYHTQLSDFTGNALDHYLTLGWKLGNDPSRQFSTTGYLEKYKDVKDWGGCPLQHYLFHGKAEGREASIATGPEQSIRAQYQGSILFVINHYDFTTQKYRVHNFVKPLMTFGWNVKVIRDSAALQEISQNWDIIVFNRIAANDELIVAQNAYRKTGGILIYDIDDLIFDPEKARLQDSFKKRNREGQEARLSAMEKIKASLLNSDLVTATTDSLASQVKQVGKAAFVIPNSLSPEMPIAVEKQQGIINICYLCGTASDDKDFKECENSIVSLLHGHENVVFNVVGELEICRSLSEHPRVVRHALMSHIDMLRFLSSMDINLAPLEQDNEFTACKSELKIFEAAFYAVPTIASRTATFIRAIRNGENGFIAGNKKEWDDALVELADNEKMRQSMGELAKKSIAVIFSAGAVAAKLHAFYAYLLAHKQKTLQQHSEQTIYQYVRKTPALSLAIVRYSGLLDRNFYAESYPDLKAVELANHYARYGCKELRKPSEFFDGWWYDVFKGEYNSQDESYNPLVHAVFFARGNNCLFSSPAKVLAQKTCSLPKDFKRACLFAAFDADGLIDDTLLTYLKELSGYCDIYFYADCGMKEKELEKLVPYVKDAWAEQHGNYDFGSYKKLMVEKLGWEKAESYDEILLANDSVYLIRDLKKVFGEMEGSDCSWWGLQATKGLAFTKDHPSQNRVNCVSHKLEDSLLDGFELNPYYDFHVGSYFIAFRKNIIKDAGFRKIFESVAYISKKNLILNYEVGISRYLIGQSFKLATFIEELPAFHPIYSENLFHLINKNGYPFLKRYLLSHNHYRVPHLGRLLEKYGLLEDDAIKKHLSRSIGRKTLDRTLRISLLDAYKASAFDRLSDAQFRELDRKIIKDPNLWVFPVCYYDHLLTGNDRALFEYVKDDPRIRKVILTRSKQIELSGINVYQYNIDSNEAQQVVLRAKNIFLKHGPALNVRYPCDGENRNFVNLWHGIPLKRIGIASLDVFGARAKRLIVQNRLNRCVIASSKIDRLAMTTGFFPLNYNQVKITGLPRIDLILKSEEELPVDMKQELENLRAELSGRKLVLYAPTFRNSQSEGYFEFSGRQLVQLKNVLRNYNAVLGVREHMADTAKSYNRTLAKIGCINLSSEKFADIELLYRLADVLITDYSSCYIDFLNTRKPVISFAYDLESYMERERGFYYDIHEVFPGPICTDFDSMLSTLDKSMQLTGVDMKKYERIRSMFFDYDDALNSQRVAELVYALG